MDVNRKVTPLSVLEGLSNTDALQEVISNLERVAIGNQIGHDKGGLENNTYSAGYVKGYFACLNELKDQLEQKALL